MVVVKRLLSWALWPLTLWFGLLALILYWIIGFFQDE